MLEYLLSWNPFVRWIFFAFVADQAFIIVAYIRFL
jgi:hypothetical protein